ncbi:transcriptional regulator MarR family [Acidaminococcus sp. CAG:917]|nr:transcriptional regulator MarR family [Acidaminococcus sp. CAG:917]
MTSFHQLIMKTHLSFAKRVLAETQKLGLSAGQPKILEFLLEVDSVEQKTIAIHCEIEPATVGTILLGMESKGLIVRKRENDNRRSLFVSLTPEGREYALKVKEIFDRNDKEIFSNFSDDEVETLKNLLNRVFDNIKIEM